MVEQEAVNFKVAGSNPARGAILPNSPTEIAGDSFFDSLSVVAKGAPPPFRALIGKPTPCGKEGVDSSFGAGVIVDRD